MVSRLEDRRIVVDSELLLCRSRLARALCAEGAHVISTAGGGLGLIGLLSAEGNVDMVIADALGADDEDVLLNGFQALAMCRTAGVDTPFVLVGETEDPGARMQIERYKDAVYVARWRSESKLLTMVPARPLTVAR